MTQEAGWVFTAAMVMIMVSACGKEKHSPPEKFIPVRILTVKEDDAEKGVRYSATIIPQTQINLAFKVSGYVDSIFQTPGPDGKMGNINRGDHVSKGIILARLKDTQYRDKVKEALANLASAEAAWVKAKQDYSRAQILYAEQSMTKPDYDSALQEYITAQANVAAARAQLDDARQNLAYCALTAPRDGVLLNRNIEVGTLAAPDTTAFVLADMETVKVVFGVPDTMLKNISLGETLAVTTRSIPDRTFNGIVTTLSPSADQQTRVFDVEITIDNAQGNLKDGMVAALKVPEFTKKNSKSILLPIVAVVRGKDNPEGYAVYTVQKKENSDYAILRDVQLGTVHGNKITILAGLKSGDQVVVSGVNTAWDGAQVRIID